jgi:hypothetical protein
MILFAYSTLVYEIRVLLYITLLSFFRGYCSAAIRCGIALIVLQNIFYSLFMNWNK